MYTSYRETKTEPDKTEKSQNYILKVALLK